MIFKLLRKYVKTFLWIMAILIIPSFILWGVGSGIRERRRTQEAGRIFGHRVSWNDYQSAYQATEMLLALSNLGAYAKFINPEELTWDRLILLHETKRRRISVKDDEIITYIQSMPAFRSGGKEAGETSFDQGRYEEILSRAFHTTPRSFEEDIRKTLLLSKLRDQVTAEVALDEETVKEEYRKSHDKRKVSYLALLTQPFEKEVEPTEKDLADYYASHKDDSSRPEEIRVAFVTVDFEKKPKAEAVALMDKMSDELFELPESEKKKESSEELKKVAEAHGLSVQETGYFSLEDPLPAPGFSYELSQEAARRKAGEISDPIQTESGIAILKVLEKRPPRVLSLEEARSDVEKAYRKEKGEALCRKSAEEMLQKIQKKMHEESAGWEDTVKSFGLSPTETPFFMQNGFVENLGQASEFTRAAFALKLQEVGGVVKIPGGFAILRPEAEEPASDEAFVKEKEAFRETLFKQKQADYYFEWFRALHTNAKLVSNVAKPEAPAD